MRLFFVRHGESEGNTNGQYSHSTAGQLTAKGAQQAEELAGRLLPETVDTVIVSPLDRAVMTVLPYLRRTDRTAEAWPELAEMAGRAEPVPPPQRPPRRGSALRLAPDAAGRVLPRTDPDGLFMPPPDETYAESCVRVLAACRRIMDLYAGRETSVLAVGHACNGARLLEGLMRIETVGRFQHGNCGMTLIEQKANGDFVVRYMNR